MPTNSYVEAAVEVLPDARRPLTTREMTDEALRRGLIPAAGKTPQNSMSARLYVAVRDNPDGPIKRLSEEGHGRAARGSVRWALKQRSMISGAMPA
jgi:hypothetical protein